MKSIAVLLVLAAVALGAVNAAHASTRLRTVLAAKEKVRASAELAQWMAARAQMLAPIKDAITTAGATPAEVETIMKAVAIRNARFEAAIGVSVQKNTKALNWVLTETIRRLICVAKTLRKNEVPQPSFETIIGELFSLPGSKYDGQTINGKKAEFIKLDNDRSGAFLSALYPQNVREVFEVVENSGNYREQLHLIARLGLIGEGMSKDDIIKYYPKSFRGLMWAIEKAPRNPVLERRCQFNYKHLEAQYSNARSDDGKKKNLLAPTVGSEVIGARKPGFKVNPHAVEGAPKAAMTLLNNKLYRALGMPELSRRERSFLIKNTIKGPVTDNTAMPWAPGAFFTKFEPHEANAQWLAKMDGQALMKDAGPSGTTDEILQFGDYVSVTSDAFGACTMRDAASAGMHLQLHHSWGEVAQGATATNRATPAFNWEDPYMALKNCPLKAAGLKAIPDVWPRPYGASVRDHESLPPAGIDHFDAALKQFVVLTSAPDSELAKAVTACDFGSGKEVQHPFHPKGEADNADRLIEHYICKDRKQVGAEVNLLTKVVCSVIGKPKPAVASQRQASAAAQVNRPRKPASHV